MLAAVDNDDLSIETYLMNHRQTHMVKDDIRAIDPLDLMERLKINQGDLDLLAGCPPCQGFSTLRTFNGGKAIADPMNDLVFEFVRFGASFPAEGSNDRKCSSFAERLSPAQNFD